MNFLNALYWIVLILAAVGIIYPAWRNPSWGAALILFIIIGLREFPVSLH